jgi:hypothetical protein
MMDGVAKMETDEKEGQGYALGLQVKEGEGKQPARKK